MLPTSEKITLNSVLQQVEALIVNKEITSEEAEKQVKVIVSNLVDMSKQNIKQKFEAYRKEHAFFTPYENKKDFFRTLLSPVVEPINLTGAALRSVLLMACVGVAAVVSLGVALCAVPSNRSVASGALIVFGVCAIVTLIFAMAALVLASLAVVSAGVGLVRNVTRAGVTVGNAVRDLYVEESSSQQSDVDGQLPNLNLN